MGIRAIIAPSFADIFAGNAFKNGVLLVELPQDAVDALLEAATKMPITVDLIEQRITTPDGHDYAFDCDPFIKTCLIEGLDEIGVTERDLPLIDRFASALTTSQPWSAATHVQNAEQQ